MREAGAVVSRLLPLGWWPGRVPAGAPLPPPCWGAARLAVHRSGEATAPSRPRCVGGSNMPALPRHRSAWGGSLLARYPSQRQGLGERTMRPMGESRGRRTISTSALVLPPLVGRGTLGRCTSPRVRLTAGCHCPARSASGRRGPPRRILPSQSSWGARGSNPDRSLLQSGVAPACSPYHPGRSRRCSGLRSA